MGSGPSTRSYVYAVITLLFIYITNCIENLLLMFTTHADINSNGRHGFKIYIVLRTWIYPTPYPPSLNVHVFPYD